MKNLKIRTILPYVLAFSLVLPGCGKKSDCEIPSKHAHLYTKEITEDITISKYIEEEHLAYRGYQWNENYIEINSEDEKLYTLLKNKQVFKGEENWDYLFYEMSHNSDYLKFYYEYNTIETYTTTDEDGHVSYHTRTVHHDGWTTNPNYIYNTGKTRLYHHRYTGYRIILENGKYKLEESEPVDDIREIIAEYPYFKEQDITYVYKTFKFNKSNLSKLNASDFNEFNQPDLSNPNLYTTTYPYEKR